MRGKREISALMLDQRYAGNAERDPWSVRITHYKRKPPLQSGIERPAAAAVFL
jgi:hypothetical protein